MSVRRWLAATLLVPLAMASACTDDEPVPKMPTPTTSEPTSEPTETETPEAETAEDFIRRFMAEEVQMQNTGETDGYLAMTDACESCEGLAAIVEEYYAAGGYVRLKPWDILEVEAYPERGPDAYAATIRASITRYRKSSNDVEETFPGGKSTYIYEVSSEGPDRQVKFSSELSS